MVDRCSTILQGRKVSALGCKVPMAQMTIMDFYGLSIWGLEWLAEDIGEGGEVGPSKSPSSMPLEAGGLRWKEKRRGADDDAPPTTTVDDVSRED